MAKIFLLIVWSAAIVINFVAFIGKKVMQARARKLAEERKN